MVATFVLAKLWSGTSKSLLDVLQTSGGQMELHGPRSELSHTSPIASYLQSLAYSLTRAIVFATAASEPVATIPITYH